MQEWVNDEPSPPLVIERGEGNYLIDTEGRRYLDGVSSLWCNVHGHCHPVIDAAVRAQLDKIAHTTILGLTHTAIVDAAAALLQVVPEPLTRAFFSENGASAVEVAIKTAFEYWQLHGQTQRSRFISLQEAYHGDTLGAVSVGGIRAFHEIFEPLLFPTAHAPTTLRRADGTVPSLPELLDGMEQTLKQQEGHTAAVIIEPVMQGAAGMLAFPDGYVAGVRELCNKYGTLLICDEVATGFGRTATMFAIDHDGVIPDIMVVGKGMTGGYLPLSATLTTEEIYSAFLGRTTEGKHLYHGHTYSGNPLAAAACVASLELFQSERTLERMQPRVEKLATHLTRINKLSAVVDIRQRGYMIGIELDPDAGGQELPATTVCENTRQHGVILRPLGAVVVWMPPLSITDDEIDLLARATETEIAALS